MHQHLLRALLVLCGAGLWMSCSSSTSPQATVAGTWHVTVGALSRGTLSPSSFDVVVTSTGPNTFAASIPTLTWSIGPLVMDGQAGLDAFSDTTKWGVYKNSVSTPCGGFEISGTLNSSKSALVATTVEVGDSTTTINQQTYCVPQSGGSATATK